MRSTFCSLLALLVLAACTAPGPSVTPPPGTPSVSSTSSAPEQTTSTTDSADASDAEACPDGDVLVSDGRLVEFERPGSDATRIAGITWRTAGDCHLVIVTFATEDGAPATTPPTISARVLRAAGVVRIATGATSSVIVDQRVEEGLLDRLFVPASTDDTRFIDLVLNGPAVARARVLTSPARLEVELEPGGPEIGQPLMSNNLVVVNPGSAATASAILDVDGYSIGELEPLTLTVLNGETTITETTLELEASPGRWLAFDISLQIGDEAYDNLLISTEDEAVIAGIPFSR